MDPITATAHATTTILNLVDKTLPKVVKALHSRTPTGREESIIKEMRAIAAELNGCVASGILPPERIDNLNVLIEQVINGQRSLGGRRHFWQRWAKQHRIQIKQVEEYVADLKEMAYSASTELQLLTAMLPGVAKSPEEVARAYLAHSNLRDVAKKANVDPIALTEWIRVVAMEFNQRERNETSPSASVIHNYQGPVTIINNNNSASPQKRQGKQSHPTKPKHPAANKPWQPEATLPGVSDEIMRALTVAYMQAASAQALPEASSELDDMVDDGEGDVDDSTESDTASVDSVDSFLVEQFSDAVSAIFD